MILDYEEISLILTDKFCILSIGKEKAKAKIKQDSEFGLLDGSKHIIVKTNMQAWLMSYY